MAGQSGLSIVTRGPECQYGKWGETIREPPETWSVESKLGVLGRIGKG